MWLFIFVIYIFFPDFYVRSGLVLSKLLPQKYTHKESGRNEN